MRTQLQILLLLIFLSFNTFSQTESSIERLGAPLITNYSPKDYSANVQNWAAIQDNMGVLYFANSEGVIVYDGTSWSKISVPNDVARCLAIDKDGRIFVGGINEFGYLESDSTGALRYASLNKFISKGKINIGDLFRIIINDDGLYIQTFSTIMLFEEDRSLNGSYLERITKNPSIKIWSTATRFNPIHSLGNRIFVHERNIGLQEMKNGKLVMLPGGDQFAQDLICIMLPFPSPYSSNSTSAEKIIVGSLRWGLYLFDGVKFEKFNNEADDYLIENRLYFRGALLGNGSYALGTQLGGIVIITQNGKLERVINKTSGLNDNTVWDLFKDSEGNLWAALDNGISKILYPSALNLLDEKSGFEGTIHAVMEFNGKLFLATNSGIFSIDPNNPDQKKFQNSSGISVQSWDILPLKNSYLAITNDGLIEVSSLGTKVIDNSLRYSYCAIRSQLFPNYIYAGLHNGLAVFEITDEGVKSIGKVDGIENGVEKILEDSIGNLWLNDISGSILKIGTPIYKSELSNYKLAISLNGSSFGSRLKIFKYKSEVYFYNKKNIFQFDERKNRIIPAKIFSKIFPDLNHSIENIYVDESGIVWCAVKVDGKFRLLQIDLKINNSKVSNYSFLDLLEEEIPADLVPLSFLRPSNSPKILWIGGGNILIKYDLNSKLSFAEDSSFKTLIRRINAGERKTFYSGYNFQQENLIEISYTENSLIFEYSASSFIREAGNEFQYLLEGFDHSWSEWAAETKKEYTNLAPGEYIFKVRSRNSLGNLGAADSFNFKILPPWYLTWWAIILIIALLLLLISYLIKYRVRYLRERNIILEKLISERIAEINDQKIRLEKQASQLLELSQIKSNFFANISHEFRTPLTLIKGQLENVLGVIKDETVKKKLHIAFSNSNKLNRLINQVLDLSKLESGKLKLEFGMIDIVPLLKNRIASFESLAEQNNIHLEFDSNIEKLFINIDAEKIEEVFDNLFSNAIKFTPSDGTISVKIEREQSDFTETALITIKDTGIGIPQEKLDHIFDRFFQADSTSTKQYEGSGLGLAIVKELVELHGGSISVSSKLNTGTAFFIRLPIDDIILNPSEPEQNINPEIPDSGEDKSLILIVEDNIEVRNYIKENLEKNYKIEEATDGEDGIKKAIENIPDLIITDVMMPIVDGFELCNKLKKDSRTSHIPIVILTAKAGEQNKLDGLQMGADEFLAKPFSPRELEIRVGNLIRIRQLLREKYKEISVINPEEIKANPIDKIFLEKVFKRIKNSIEDRELSVQKLAVEMAMSVSQLNRKLNALINQSAGKLIRSTKLDYAAKLLEKNAGNITEIAFRIGFADLPSFTNSFKKKFGVSPSEYLKNLK